MNGIETIACSAFVGALIGISIMAFSGHGLRLLAGARAALQGKKTHLCSAAVGLTAAHWLVNLYLQSREFIYSAGFGGVPPEMYEALIAIFAAAAISSLRAGIAKAPEQWRAILQQLVRDVLGAAQAGTNSSTKLTVEQKQRADELLQKIADGIAPEPPPVKPVPGTNLAVVGLFAALLLGAPAIASAKPPEVVVNIEINGRSYPLPERGGSAIQAVAGDDLWFDLAASEGEPDRCYAILENRQPGQKQLEQQGMRWRLLTHAGAYRLRFLVSNGDGFDELIQPVEVLCSSPLPPGPPMPPQPSPPPSPSPNPAPIPTPTPTPAPEPAPKPVTPVDPGGPVPPGEFGIAPGIYSAARKIGDRSGAQQLADAAKQIAADVREGKISSVQDVINHVAKAVKAGGAKWQQLLPMVETALRALISSGKLDASDIAAWGRLLEEIGQALARAASDS